MTWTDRVGNIVRGVVVLATDFATIGSELLKQAAVALDNFLDGLKENIEPKKPPIP